MKTFPPLSLGYSPCPNDTYIFNALVHGHTQCSGLRFAAPRLEDVETLNQWALASQLDVTKVSFHAYGHLRNAYNLFPAGAALGRGCGPLLITTSDKRKKAQKDWKIAIPGKYTTAALLLRLYNPSATNLVVMRFEQIMDAVCQGMVDAGVIIHESRFTYQKHGLGCVQDLGEWWEQETGLPIPLGCIVMKKHFPKDMRQDVAAAIKQSILWADSHPHEVLPYISQHAQEMTPEVMHSHIALYVNEFSKDLGKEGERAIHELLLRGNRVGLF